MENKSFQTKESKLLQHLGNLRKMIVENHELENLSEFVLHDICSGPSFNIDKAAYFINNQDFNILQGIAGYHKQEQSSLSHDDRWNNQKKFITSMKNSLFNQKVRNKLQESFQKGQISEQYMVRKLADYLEIENPAYHIWNLKHANHGLLIYEPSSLDHKHEYLLDSLYYLSFCPVY